MKMYNKKGEMCNADVDQMEIMKKTGWSTSKPKVEPVKLTEAEAKKAAETTKKAATVTK